MIKLIASDLDGTLLQDHAQELSPRALSLIHQISEIISIDFAWIMF